MYVTVLFYNLTTTLSITKAFPAIFTSIELHYVTHNYRKISLCWYLKLFTKSDYEAFRFAQLKLFFFARICIKIALITMMLLLDA